MMNADEADQEKNQREKPPARVPVPHESRAPQQSGWNKSFCKIGDPAHS
jgi:hypothetical protein